MSPPHRRSRRSWPRPRLRGLRGRVKSVVTLDGYEGDTESDLVVEAAGEQNLINNDEYFVQMKGVLTSSEDVGCIQNLSLPLSFSGPCQVDEDPLIFYSDSTLSGSEGPVFYSGSEESEGPGDGLIGHVASVVDGPFAGDHIDGATECTDSGAQALVSSLLLEIISSVAGTSGCIGGVWPNRVKFSSPILPGINQNINLSYEKFSINLPSSGAPANVNSTAIYPPPCLLDLSSPCLPNVAHSPNQCVAISSHAERWKGGGGDGEVKLYGKPLARWGGDGIVKLVQYATNQTWKLAASSTESAGT